MNAPDKKTGRGCLIALGVFGAIGVLVLVGGGIVAYKIAQFPQVKKIAGVAYDTKKLIEDAQKAPGTKELRKRGCTQAMVMDAERWMATFSPVFNEASAPPPPEEKLMVICQVGVLARKAVPSCDDVKTTYLAVVPAPSGDLLVQVT